MYEVKNFVNAIFDGGADGISFVPVFPTGDLQMNGFQYARKYKPIKTDLGNFYHILLYKLSNRYNTIDVDNFTAILTDPRVYVANLIENDFYGVVVKQTTGSKKFISELHKKMLNT